MRVVLGLSGGIDSAYAARLLQESGHEVIAATLITETSNAAQVSGEKAKALASELGIEHITKDISRAFKKEVINPFVRTYCTGKTPNPCITCNQYIKFPALLEIANHVQAEKIATGHYADCIEAEHAFFVKRARDEKKDQSYFLSRLPQTILSRTLFPLAQIEKDSIAKPVQYKESEDICFLHGEKAAAYLLKHAPKTASTQLVDETGELLGQGAPLFCYTPGQRKGIGLAKGPWYVHSLDARTQTVQLSHASPSQHTFLVSNITSPLTLDELVKRTSAVQIRFRSAQKLATYTIVDKDTLQVQLASEYGDAIAPGQTAAFYNKDIVLGGGEIVDVIA